MGIIDQQNQPSTSATESGFVPPLVEPISSTTVGSLPTMVKQEYEDMSYGSTPSSQKADPEWLPPGAKRARMATSSGGFVSANPTPNYTLPDVTPNATVTSSGTRRPTGPRSRKPNVQLTVEEEQRRTVRRERNKLAAAKCRQRRVDLTNTLINQSEGLEEEQAKLEEEIQNLQSQKEQLEFLLEAHKPLCSKKGHTACTTASTMTVASSVGAPMIKVEKPLSPPSSRPTSLAIRPHAARTVVTE